VERSIKKWIKIKYGSYKHLMLNNECLVYLEKCWYWTGYCSNNNRQKNLKTDCGSIIKNQWRIIIFFQVYSSDYMSNCL
jgi:hypothetical protein